MTFASVSDIINKSSPLTGAEASARKNTGYLCQAAKTALVITGIIAFIFANPTSILGVFGWAIGMVLITDAWKLADRVGTLAKHPELRNTPQEKADYVARNMWLLGAVVSPMIDPATR